jgi:Restriction Endonuclease associating with ARP
MTYRDKEKSRCEYILNNVIRGQGNGIFGGKQYPFVLQQGELNIWDGIREDVLDYFAKNSIAWWRGGSENKPTGHILSSQIACINHLYWLRSRKDASSALVKNLHPDIIDVEKIGDGYVDFEVVGKDNYLGEKSHSRGANATAFDAVMVAKKNNGNNLLIAIEWKYTEYYTSKSLYKPARAEIYDRFFSEDDCPLNVQGNESVYYEPYYQLMRQTLLCWKMVQAQEYGCDDYIHVHAIPEENKELLETNTSPLLDGKNLSDAWKSVLKDPGKYRIIDPSDLLKPVMDLNETKSIVIYLQKRYWKV